MNIQQAVTLIHRIAVLGPTPAMYSNVTEAFKVMHNHGMPSEQVSERLVEPSFATLDGSLESEPQYFNFIASVFNQPFGYAGDWLLLSKFYAAYDMYYEGWSTGGIPEIRKGKYRTTQWDNYFLSLPCGQSVMNRETYLMTEIGKLIQEKGVRSILDIACGNGRLIKKLAKLYPHCIFQGIDNEPTAIKAGVETDYPDNCTLTEMNAIVQLPYTKPDLVVSAGLCDYLDDKHFSRLVRRIEDSLNPRYVILGNLTTHDSIPQMELLKWKLIYRSPIDLISLVSNYFRGSRFRVGEEHCGVNLFLHIESKE